MSTQSLIQKLRNTPSGSVSSIYSANNPLSRTETHGDLLPTTINWLQDQILEKPVFEEEQERLLETIHRLKNRLEKNFRCYKVWIYTQMAAILIGTIVHVLQSETLEFVYTISALIYSYIMFMTQLDAINLKSFGRAQKSFIMMILALIIGGLGVLILLIASEYSVDYADYHNIGDAAQIQYFAHIGFGLLIIHTLTNIIPSNRVKDILGDMNFFIDLIEEKDESYISISSLATESVNR